MKKQLNVNGIVGIIEEAGELTYSVRVEDDSYYYLDVIIQIQDGKLVAIHNGSALGSIINNLQGFLILNIDRNVNINTRMKLAEKMFNAFYQLIA